MGCPLGSLGFDLALHADIVVRSLTDDCNLAVQLPSEPADADATLRHLHGALSGIGTAQGQLVRLLKTME
jgi:hypothetical protein